MTLFLTGKQVDLMDFFVRGKPKVVSEEATTANGDTSVDVRPAAGKRWLVIVMWGEHDDTIDRNCNWQFYDGTTTVDGVTLAMGANKGYPLCQMEPTNFTLAYAHQFLAPVILTRNVYAQFKGASLATGKKVYAKGLVLELDEFGDVG